MLGGTWITTGLVVAGEAARAASDQQRKGRAQEEHEEHQRKRREIAWRNVRSENSNLAESQPRFPAEEQTVLKKGKGGPFPVTVDPPTTYIWLLAAELAAPVDPLFCKFPCSPAAIAAHPTLSLHSANLPCSSGNTAQDDRRTWWRSGIGRKEGEKTKDEKKRGEKERDERARKRETERGGRDRSKFTKERGEEIRQQQRQREGLDENSNSEQNRKTGSLNPCNKLLYSTVPEYLHHPYLPSHLRATLSALPAYST